MSAAWSNEQAWSWLLGRDSRGDWRLRDARERPPASDPQILLLRRVVATPKACFPKIIESIARTSSKAAEELGWRYMSRKGPEGRRHWLIFQRRPARNLVGLELIDRAQLGLWFFAGFQEPHGLDESRRAPYEDNSEVCLPRFLLSDADELPIDRWLSDALAGRLDFRPAPDPAVVGTACDRSALIDATLALMSGADERWLRALRPRVIPLDPPGSVIELQRARCILGRSDEVDIKIQQPTVSGRHVLLEVDDERLWIHDLESRNGLKVDGWSLRPGETRPLADLSIVELGDARALISCEAARESTRQELALSALVTSAVIDPERLVELRGACPADCNLLEWLVLRGHINAEAWLRHDPQSDPLPNPHLRPIGLAAAGLLLVAGLCWLWLEQS
jgi:hypothetical protein